MVQRSITAATRLESEGISVEIIDPRTLRPLDIETILTSVRKTGRLMIVHEAPKFGGFGGEIATEVTEQAIDYLNAPIVRVTAPETPVPFSPTLEENYLPSDAKIAEAAIRLLKN